MTRIDQLANGLTVITRPMPGLETASVGLFASVGSRHESARDNGLAHLFEHMVFKGAGGRSARALSEAIEDVGGELNACTERDGTSFTTAVLGEHLPLAVELLGDLVCRPHLDQADLVREAEVVLQELAEAEDTPSDIVFDELWAAAFADQPLGRSILGSEGSVRGITIDDLVRWRDRHYLGGDLILSAAGAVDHDHLIELAERHLATIAKGKGPAAEPATFTARTRHSQAKAGQSQITLGWKAPRVCDPDYFAARLFADIVGGGASSRLFQSVREERGLAYSVSASLHPHEDVGLFYVHAATSKAEGRAARTLIRDVLAEAAETVDQREVDRARIQIRASLAMSGETPWGQASRAAREWSIYGRLLNRSELSTWLEAISVDHVRAAGARMLANEAAEATLGLGAAKAA